MSHVDASSAQLQQLLSGRAARTISRLRELAPTNPPSPGEALRLAERQADQLLKLAGSLSVPIALTQVADLLALDVRLDAELPASGCAHWLNGRWLVVLNAREPLRRSRFSFVHEVKHIVDNRDAFRLYASVEQAHVAADHFAACLLMPKRAVERALEGGVQHVNDLAALFEVSPEAMDRRLRDLRLSGALTPTTTQERSSAMSSEGRP